MALTTITIPQIAVEKTNLVGNEMLIARDVDTGQDVRVSSASLSGAINFAGDGTDQSAEFQAVIDGAPERSLIVIRYGTVLGLGAQVVVNKPLTIINYGTVKALGAPGVAGDALIKITSRDAHIHNYGLLDGNSTLWSGVIFSGTNRLFGNTATPGFNRDFAPGSLSTAQFCWAFDAVENGHIFPGYAQNCGGQNLYTQFCKNVTGDGFTGQDVGYTTVNSAANLDCTFNNMRCENVGYFGLKAGYGLSGSISNNITPTSTTFSVAATAQNKKIWTRGQHFLIVFNTSACLFPVVKSVTDNGAYLTITTAKAMAAIPSAGMELQFVDNTTWNDPVVCNTGDNGFDFNIVGGGGSINRARSYFCGHYTGLGNHLMLGAAIWIGADPQGSNEGFRINNYTVNDCHAFHIAGSAVEIFGIGENVYVNNPKWFEVDELKEAPGAATPQYGGVEMNRLNFGFARNFGVNNPCGKSSNGYSVLIGASLYAFCKGGDCESNKVGLVLQEFVGGLEIIDPAFLTSGAASSALEVRAAGTPSGLRVKGGRLVANGSGSVGFYNKATNASNFHISRETEILVEPIGTRIVNLTGGLTIAPEFDNTIPGSVVMAKVGQPVDFYVQGEYPATAVIDCGEVAADNGTNGLIILRGTVWSAAGGKHSFVVYGQGHTASNNASGFATLGTAVSAFLNAGDFTTVTTTNGFKLRYTNNSGVNVRIDAKAELLPRF